MLGDYKPITITPIQTIQRLESKLQHNENRWNIIRDWAGVDDQSGAVVMKTRTFLLNENQETVGELNGLQNEVGFDRLKVGTLLAPNVVSYGATDKDLYVNFASGDDEAATNTIDTPYRSIARCLQEIPHYNNGKIRIFFQSNGTEIVEIKGVHGSGSVEFFMQGYTLDGMFHLEGSTNIIRIQNGTLNFLGTNQYGVIKAYRCAYVHIENMKIFGRGVTDTIVTIHDRSYCYIKNSLLQDAIHHLMIAQFGGFIVNEENVGSNARFGVFAWLGGVVAGSGTCPTGTTTPIRADKGGEIRGTLTPYAGDTGQPPPPAPPTVLTFPVLQGRSYRSGGVTGWRSEKLVYQGEWSGYGLHRGLWMFGNNPSASVTGKEIKRIRFYCTRLSKGGNSGSVPFYFRYHSYLDANSLPSGAPALSSLAVTASFSWGQGKWVDLSHPDFLTAFRNGTAKGIGLFLNNRSSSYYGIFDAPGTLEITY
ncbi:hypothetical protein [Risungbinella massiliensis]|uniref:hypothetical protein n=1 Tax=Risungbinella massiliensis TaxID=1329796 RepID=UPI0005CBBEF0|nr:hypothetical protein [Risungbinella massiliensis]